MKVSIVVPSYNQAKYVDECLDSVHKQTYTDWECIVVNDGSTDNIDAVIQPWLNKDQRFKYITTDNKGVSHARNTAIKASEGALILPLDADDKIANTYLDLAVDAFKTNPELTLVYCRAEKFGDVNEVWHLKPFSLKALALDNIIFCSGIYKKKDWERVNGYDERMQAGLEDWEFWIALLKHGGNVLQLDATCFYYRIKAVSRQQQLNAENKRPIYEYLSVKHADFFVSQLGDFQTLYSNYLNAKKESFKSVNSKKKALDVFTLTFFGFSFFKKY